ncbi:MAG: hypothetical protein V4739_02825, partial [Pseudomonadota bacterium]
MTQVAPAEDKLTVRRMASDPAAKDSATQAALLAWMQGMVSAIPDESPPGQAQARGASVRLHASATGPGLPEGGEDSAHAAALAARIDAEIKADSGTSGLPWDPLDPTSSTPLQTLLDEAVNGLPRSVLLASPSLLAAVRAGFQTEGGRQFALAANIIEADLVGDLSQPVAPVGAVQPRRRLTETDFSAEVDATFVRGDGVSEEMWAPVETRLKALAANSPDFRNVMARARTLNNERPLVVVLDPSVSSARFEGLRGTIRLQSLADPRQAVSWIVFESNNGARKDLLKENVQRLRERAEFSPAQAAALDGAGARIISGGFRRYPRALNAYLDREVRQPEVVRTRVLPAFNRLKAAHPDWSFERLQGAAVQQVRESIKTEALERPASLRPFIDAIYDTPEARHAFRASVLLAYDHERTELAAAHNHHLIFDQLRSDRRTVPLSAEGEAVLQDADLLAMDAYRDLPTVRRGLAAGFTESMDLQMQDGHTARYLEQGLALQGQVPLFGPEALGLADLGDVVVEAPLASAGAEAGLKTRSAVEAAVDEHGSKGDPVAARAAVEASLRKESLGLAERILASPEMAGVVKVLGEAGTAALAVQLAEAIYT